MLRDGGTYVEMGQFTDAGSIESQLAPDVRQRGANSRELSLHSG